VAEKVAWLLQVAIQAVLSGYTIRLLLLMMMMQCKHWLLLLPLAPAGVMAGTGQ
jgi:hypothetical protein